MEKVTIYPKTKLSLEKEPREILKIWEKALGIWKRKKIEPIKYLQRIKKEWERKSF